MSFGGASCRLIELGEREGGKQLVAARALLLRDGKGGLEGFLRWGGVGGIAAEQDLAAQAMEVRVGVALPRLLRGRQSLVDQRQSGVRTPRRGLELGEQPVKQWRVDSICFVELFRQRPPYHLSAGLRVVKSTARPTRICFAHCDKELHLVFSDQCEQRLG